MIIIVLKYNVRFDDRSLKIIS